jgi:serine/threonine protein kinase
MTQFEDHFKLLKELQNTEFSESIKSVIGSCLVVDPLKRPDARSLLSAIKACINKGKGINLVPISRSQLRTLSSPGPILKHYHQVRLKSSFNQGAQLFRKK